MKEAAFIRQNAPKWEKFEHAIKSGKNISADELSDLYISLQDDLAYASTFYSKSATTRYLNELTGYYHRAIYKNKRERGRRFITFWQYEVPYAILKSHRQLFYALVIFLISVAIGVVSSVHDEDFVRLILGDSYVNMTLENIRKGDALGVYHEMHRTTMFFAISSNNIYVSFLTYVMGIFASLGTVYMLFSNGVMLGTFQYFFYQKHLFLTSVLGIYLHGALELSALIIAGGAGLVLGNSLLFPGTYSRIDSITEAASRSLKIIVGLIPVFVVAASIESFVTRYYNVMPAYLNVSIIVVSFAFIVWYFIIYPLHLKKPTHERENGTA